MIFLLGLLLTYLLVLLFGIASNAGKLVFIVACEGGLISFFICIALSFLLTLLFAILRKEYLAALLIFIFVPAWGMYRFFKIVEFKKTGRI